MASQTQWFLLMLLGQGLVVCGAVAVHHHSVDTAERESDGSYRARDAEHYDDSGHNVDFDHEAILGSVKEAEKFERLSPEESRARLAELLPKMDLDGDKIVQRAELKKWILKSFENLSKEEAQERMKDIDMNKDNEVTWSEYLQESFGVNSEDDLSAEDLGDHGMMVTEERLMWNMADKNGDGKLDMEEFEVFTNPEEHPEMHALLINQTMREKDINRDGRIDFQEYVGERALHEDREWVASERDRFATELDLDKDGELTEDEIKAWIIPDNDEIADEEVEHLFEQADDDRDGRLAFDEVLSHHDVFVGSEATDFGNDLLGQHFDDEL